MQLTEVFPPVTSAHAPPLQPAICALQAVSHIEQSGAVAGGHIMPPVPVPLIM